MQKKLQIRHIIQISGDEFDIYDVMYKNKFGYFISRENYETLEDALKWHPGIHIEDKRKEV